MILFALIAASTSLAATPVREARLDNPGCELTVVLQCQITPKGEATGCTKVSEDPNTVGAGAMALSMTSQFRLPAGDGVTPRMIPIRIHSDVCVAAR